MSIAQNMSRDGELGAFIGASVPALSFGRQLLHPGQLREFLVTQRLNYVARTARVIPFDSSSRLVFFSDCHRGDRSCRDAFAPNEKLFLRALDHYFRRGFSYVEVGDGDELWQNRRFRDILGAHRPVFDLLHRFDHQGRLQIITGNHDVSLRWQRTVNKDGMISEDGLILHHKTSGQRILVTHGHQADIVSDRLSPVSRLAVRYLWRYMQDWRITDLIRDLRRILRHPAGVPGADTTATLLTTIEKRLIGWVEASRQMIICGHTHRAHAAVPGAPPYFNTGSFVKPNEATGLEIQGGAISLIRWVMQPLSGQVRREVIMPPRRLAAYA